MLQDISKFMLLMLFTTIAVNAYAVNIRPSSNMIIQSKEKSEIMLVIVNNKSAQITGSIDLTFNEGTVSCDIKNLTLKPKEWQVVKLIASLNKDKSAGKISCSYNNTSAVIDICRGINLSGVVWKRARLPKGLGMEIDNKSMIDSNSWSDIIPPAIWEEAGISCCKIDVQFPASLRGEDFKLIIGAIDDNDAVYLNGHLIGKTEGWDTRREYAIKSDIINWDGDNALVVMVNNVSAGGGLTKNPFVIVPADVELDTPENKVYQPMNRTKPGKVGNPLPIRPIHNDNGILRYPEGDEVALWGTNYYPQSWYQFENMTKLNIDMKAAIKEDLDHMKHMGVDIIRVHVFDREISDGDGNIIDNIHLDLLDYLIAEAGKRSIYFYLAPIAWWAGPNEIPGAFSQVASKPGMMYVPKAKAAAMNYLHQFMTRKNRYTGNSYKDEPNICFFEVMNEPSYFLYSDMHGQMYTPQGEKPEILAADKEVLKQLWNEWLSKHGLEDKAEFFPIFRYELMRTYIKEMIGAIRAAGAKQPVAINYGLNGEDLINAIADSECDAITFSAYPGGLSFHIDGINKLPLLKQMGKNGKVNLPYYDYAFDGRLDKKARAAYEFDNDGSNTGSYIYPAIASSFRSGGFQIACQFQYDSSSTAKWNTDWGTHWLNWLYTPSKTVSYMLAGEAFKLLPREIQYDDPNTELVLPPMATSFTNNISILSTNDTVMYSRTISNWQPLKFPAKPKRIVGTGSSKYITYGGTGIYVLETIDANTIKLTINPDARLLGDCMSGSFAAPVAELEYNTHWFKLNLPGWNDASCERLDARRKKPVTSADGGWLVTPGEYMIHR